MTEFVFGARPPAEALAYLTDKVPGARNSFDYRDVVREEHLVSFVVAKGAMADIQTDLHDALVEAMKAGTTKAQFIRDLKPILQAKGWWGKALATDPLTGETLPVQLGSPSRLSKIFSVNMAMAHSAGRWERFSRSSATRPYLTYKHTPQANPRPDHQGWDGITLPIGHVFWETHCAPNGYHCKCYFVSVRKGPITPVDELEQRGVFETRPWRNKRTGEELDVPVGVDPGFGYNVGQARLKALVPPALPERQRDLVVGPRFPRSLPPLIRPRNLPDGVRLRQDLGGADAQTVFEAFSKVLGKGEGEVFVDRAQIPVVVGKRLFERHDAAGVVLSGKEHLAGRAAYAEILAATLKDPDEIWHSIQTRADGSSVAVRNYLASFKSGDGRETFVASFHHRDGVWWGTTAYGPGKRGRENDQATQTNVGFRVGSMVYRRR